MKLSQIIMSFSLVCLCAMMVNLVLPSAEAQAKGKDNKEWRVSPRKAKKKNPIAADQASVDVGKQVYDAECKNCHGKAGKGDGPEAKDLDKPVRDFTTEAMWAQSDGAIAYKIRSGRRPMPSFKKMLSKDDIWHVTNYIRKTFSAK